MKHTIKLLSTLIIATLLLACKQESPFSGTDNRITEFKLTIGSTEYVGEFATENIININIPLETDLAGAKASYKISEQASILPDPEKVTDWNSEQVFNVVSYSGAKRTYIVRINKQKIHQEGSIVLATNEDVAAFVKKNISSINGDLIIGEAVGKDSIDNVDALTYLEKVSYKVVVNPTYKGKDLGGLRNLQEVGSLIVNDPKEMTSLELKSLRLVNEEVNISSKTLTNVALEALEEIGGAVSIEGEKLTGMRLPVLKRVGGTMEFKKTGISDLKLLRLESVAGELKFTSNGPLVSLSMPRLKEIQGQFSFNGSNLIPILTLGDLETIDGDLNFKSLKISEVYLPKLKKVKSLLLNGLTELQTFFAPELKTVEGKVDIRNVKLKSIDDIGIETIGESLSIASATSLNKISKFFNRVKQVQKIDLNYILSPEEFNLSSTGAEAISLTNCNETPRVILPEKLKQFNFNGDRYMERNGGVPVIEGCKEIEESFNVRSLKVKEPANLIIKDLAKGGKIFIDMLVGIPAVELPALLESESLEMGGSANEIILHTVKAPKLTSLNELSVRALKSIKEFQFPAIKRIGFINLSYSNWASNESLEHLNGLKTLEKVEKIELEHLHNFSDFSFLKKVIENGTLTQEVWDSNVTLTNLKYMPTFEDLKNGRFVEQK